MFDSTRNQVRKRVEHAEWIRPELQALKLEKVCLQVYIITLKMLTASVV
jgi:hypothetical protein